MKKVLGYVVIFVVVAAAIATGVLPPYVDAEQNKNLTPGRFDPPEAVRELHDSLTIMDWHADTLLWNRDLLSEYERGHVDVPRLQRGNVALQMFTVVSRAPKGQNYVSPLITRLPSMVSPVLFTNVFA